MLTIYTGWNISWLVS